MRDWSIALKFLIEPRVSIFFSRSGRLTLAGSHPSAPLWPSMKSPNSLPEPPWPLGQHGRKLWDKVQSEWIIEDAGGLATLEQICKAIDRAEALAERVDREGEVLQGPNGPRPHPFLKDEAAYRAVVVRGLKNFGILDEPLRMSGGAGHRRKGER